MYTHVSKCKNDKIIKRKKRILQWTNSFSEAGGSRGYNKPPGLSA
jgi:hypothetical protein